MNTIQKTNRKYLLTLKDIKSRCESRESFGLGNVMACHGVGNGMGKVLVENKILLNKGSKSRPNYHWNTIEPNLKMANRVREEMAKNIYNYQKPKTAKKIKNTAPISDNVKKPKRTTTSAREELKETLYVSILWGLFKFKKQIK